MRRITTWLLSTISALVLLFSYHTSTDSGAAASVVAESDTGTTDSDTGSSDTGSSMESNSGASSTDSGTSSTDSGTSSTDSGTSSTDSGTSSTDSASSTDSGSSSTDGTYTGDAIMTRFGNVQVQITVEDGRITKSEVTQVPWSDHKDQEINSYAVPILNAAAVDAQSADIDMVSGATFTSEGYIGSLQSAIDQANL